MRSSPQKGFFVVAGSKSIDSYFFQIFLGKRL